MKRIGSIDALRGMTILAMILCAAVNWGSGLPAWMFHCQTPPPDFVFRPEVRGLTWVDLVFPVFIFSMGAAIPVSLGKKLSKGVSMLPLSIGAFRRALVLILFSLVLGAADAASGGTAGEWAVSVLRSGLWLALFAALVRTERRWINYAGWGLVAVLVLVEWLAMGVRPSLANNDCIILLLAYASLMCSLVWLVTRNSIRIRLLIAMLVLAAQMAGFTFTQYLVIAIPATVAGDWLLDGRERCPGGKRSLLAALSGLAAVILQFWGLFVREVPADFLLTMVLAAVFVSMTLKDRSSFSLIGLMGFAMLLGGIALDPVCGGIAKDYCNASYLLVTGGQAALLLSVFLRIEKSHPLSPALTMPGQNPMIAYTISWYVICPILSLVGLMPLVSSFCSQNPWLGFLQGVLVTILAAALTSLFTRFKIFLRS